MENNIVIETRNISKIFKSGSQSIKAVDQASIEIHSGEFVALVGPSGSGKTTMLAMLAALLTPSEGQVLINGQDLAVMSDKERAYFRGKEIGFAFQANNLIPFLTVLENVDLMLRINNNYNKETRQDAIELLTRLGLGDRLHNLPRQLSGGQRQRASIARTLIHHPSVVLADEPTANLDTERAYQVVEIYADLIHEQNKAGIMVTHDLRMCRYVDKIIQIEDGKITSILADQSEIDDLIACH